MRDADPAVPQDCGTVLDFPEGDDVFQISDKLSEIEPALAMMSSEDDLDNEEMDLMDWSPEGLSAMLLEGLEHDE